MEKLLLPPDETGYSVSENAGSLSTVALDGGRPRERLDIVGGTRTVNLQWSGSQKRYMTVKTFLADNLGNNCEQFLMDLIIADSTYQEYTCNLIPGSIKTKPNSLLNWTISAQFDVEPRDDESTGNPIGAVFTEDFDEGIGGYSTISGNGALFTLISSLYGSALRVGSQSAGTTARIDKVIGSATFIDVEWKFRLGPTQSDDAGGLAFYNGGSLQFAFAPKREAFFSPGRLPYFIYQATNIPVSATALLENVWYRARFRIRPGDNNSTMQVTNLDTGIDITNGLVGGAYTPLTCDRISFSADNGGQTIQTDYTDIYLDNNLNPPPDTPLLDSPDYSAYGFSESSSERFSVNYGVAGVYRRNLLNGCYEVDASWQTDAAGYDAITNIYRTSISEGGSLFNCDMFLDDATLRRYKCNFVQGSLQLQSIQGLTYNVSVKLQLVNGVYDVIANPWITDTSLGKTTISLTAGLFVLSPQNANFHTTIIKSSVSYGAFVLRAKDAELTHNPYTPQKLSVSAASFALTPQAAGLSKAINPLRFITQTADYTLVLADMDNRTWVRMNVGTANNLHIPTNASVSAKIGTTVLFSQFGGGLTTIVPDSGVTIRHSRTLVTSGANAAGGMTLIDVDVWEVFGDLT